MAYNGLGTFLINSTGQPVSAGQTITSAIFNAFTSDIGTGLTNAVCKDGQQTTTALIPFAFGLSTDTLQAYTPSGPVTVTYGQLKFPATQVASANVNTLDDYEEGTWTPTDVSGDSLSFVIATGRYEKVGSGVTISGIIQFPVTAGANLVTIGGLPFTANNTIAQNMDGFCITFANTSRNDTMLVTRNTTTVLVYGTSGNQPANALYSNKTFSFSGWYQAAS